MRESRVFLFFVAVFLGACANHSRDKQEAHTLVNGGEWIVKYTEFDKVPAKVNSDGTTTTTAFGSSCAYCKAEDGLDLRVGKQTDPYDVGDYGLCIRKSNPQYSVYAGLRRGDRIRFEFVDTPTQEECAGEAMFLKLRESVPTNNQQTPVSYIIESEQSRRYIVNDGVSETTLWVTLSEDGIGNRPYYRVGQKYYELEVNTPQGMTEFNGLLQPDGVVWVHNERSRTPISDAALIEVLDRLVALGRSLAIGRDGEPVPLTDFEHRQTVLNVISYPELSRYFSRPH